MNPTIRQVIGQNVQARRVAAGLSQKAFAKDALKRLAPDRAWTVNAVSEYETGKRTWTADDVVLFARALGVSPAALVTIPEAVEFVDVDSEPVSRQSIQPDAPAPGDADAPLQAIARVTRALDTHLDQISALHGAVEQTYADAIGVRKTWLRQTGQQSQPRKEDT